VLRKLDGLDEYDLRRPLVATVEWGHLGAAFGQPFEESLSWGNDAAEPNADLWATDDQSREYVVGLYRRIAAHSDGVIDTCRSTPSGVCRGGRRSSARSRCTASSCTRSPRRTGTPAAPTSSVS
jgi:Protein of unknown function (DUF664)